MMASTPSVAPSFSSMLYVAKPEPMHSSINDLPYTQLWQHFPVLDCLYTSAEKSFVAKPYVDLARRTWPALPLAFIALYVALITLGPHIMKNRKALDLKRPLALWNLALSIFSILGAMRLIPHLFHELATTSFRHTICGRAARVEGASGMWIMLFVLSKVPELVDTFFIVSRKSKLIFLHWYHHITVLLLSWHSYAFTSSMAFWFAAMNYSVHAIMYGYYLLMAIKAWPKWIPASLITMVQISQMIMGSFICLMAFVYLHDGMPCDVNRQNLWGASIIYSTYLYLFSHFFIQRFIMGVKPGGRKTKAM